MTLPSWVTNLTDAKIKADITAAINAGSVSFASMQQLFSDLTVEVGAGTLTASQFSDLQAVVANIASVGASAYVTYISNALVDGNALSLSYTGGQVSATTLSPLGAGSNATTLSDLIGTWFLGNNHPSSSFSSADGFTPLTYGTTGLPLYSAGGPTMNDINQGQIGDCYFVCGLAEVALQDPSAIQDMIHDNGNGTYGVRFYINDQPQWVTIDSKVALSGGSQIFNDANLVSPPNIWVGLLEKAYAELSAQDTSSFAINDNVTTYNAGNSFSSIGSGGFPELTIAQVTGASTLHYLFSSPTDDNWQTYAVSTATGQYTTNPVNGVSDATTFSAIAAAFDAGHDVVMASYFASYDTGHMLQLDSSHAFSVIGVDSSTQSIELRNPWGVSTGQSWETTFWITLPELDSLEATASAAAGGIPSNDYFAYDDNMPPPALTLTPVTTDSSGATYIGFANSISATDVNGVSASALVYTITVTGTGGVLDYNGTAETVGTSFQVTGANLSELQFIPSVFGGTTTLSVSVSDGLTASASGTLTITSPNTPGPTVTPLQATVSLSAPKTYQYVWQLFDFSEPDPNGTILRYEFKDIAATGSTGWFFLGPSIIEPTDGTVFDVYGASALTGLSYVLESGSQTISMRADDGTASTPHWSDWASVTLHAPLANPPTLTVQSTTEFIHPYTSFVLSDLISAISNNGQPSSDMTYTLTVTAGAGYFYDLGDPEASPITMSAIQLSQSNFAPTVASGTATISIIANDGFAASAAQTLTFTLIPAVQPTVKVTVPNFSTLEGSVASGSLFSVTGNNGESAAQMTYWIQDDNGPGYFTLNGTVVPSGTSAGYLNATQFSELVYHAALSGGSDLISYVISDDYSAVSGEFHISAPGLVVTGKTITASSHAQSFAASSLFTAADAAGAITSYTFDDQNTGTGAGFFMLGSVKEAQSTAFTVTAGQLSSLTYIGPSIGTDTITIAVTGGGFTTSTSTITVNGPPATGPTVTAASLTLNNEAPYSNFASLISVKDVNGVSTSGITYTITFTGAAGVLDVNGVAETAGVSFTLNAAELSKLSYVPSAAGGVDTVQISANDGYATGNTATFKITTPAPPPGPKLTAKSATVTALSTAFVTDGTISAPTDPNGVAPSNFTYTLSYTGAGGALSLSGVTEAEGTSISLSATDLANLKYSGSIYGGADIFTLTASDGFGTSTVTFALTTAAYAGPVVTLVTNKISATRDQSFSFSNLVTGFTDTYSGATVQQYQFLVTDTAGGVGSFVVGGTAQANDTIFTINAADTGTLSYLSVSGSETIYVRANDGTSTAPHWGVWTSATVTGAAKTPLPVVTAGAKTVTALRDQTFSYSSLFSAASEPISNSYAAVSQYQFLVVDTAGGVGSWLVGGVAKTNDVVFTVNAADRGTVSFQSVSGSETLYVRANDGTADDPNWGAWATTTINGAAKTQLPVVTAKQTAVSASRDQSFAYLALFNTGSEQSASSYAAITQYEFLVVDTAGSVGSWLVGGVAKPNDVVFTVNAADLNTVDFQSVSGTETLYVRANDGTAADPNWGAWATTTINGAAKTQLPVVTAEAKTLTASRDQIFLYSSGLFTAAEPSSSPYAAISQYDLLVSDAAGGVGSWLVNGTAIANDVVFAVSAATIDTVSFQSVSGTETVYVRANDGTAADPNWGAWATIKVNGAAKTQLPVVTVLSKTVSAAQDQIIGYSSMFGITTDASTSIYASVSQYDFLVADSAGGVGSLLVGGTAQANDVVIAVNASDLGTVSFESVSGTETIYVRANDGTAADPNWGGWVSTTIKGATQHPGPVFTAINAKITTVQGGETVATPVTTFFNEIDAGGYPLAQYQVIDAAGAGSVGNFLVNGVAKANGAAVTVNASDLSTLSYKFQSGSQVLWIRANDGTAADPNWGAWASVTVTTPALTPSASPASHLPPLSASAVIPPLSSAATSIVSPAAMLTATSSSPAPLFALHNL